MKRTGLLTLLAASALVGVYALVPSQASTVEARDMTPEGVLMAVTGRTSDMKERQYRLASSQEVFDQLWVQHMGDRVERAAQGWPMTPQLDFEKCEAVLIFGGDQTNMNGYRVVEVLEEDDAVTIRFDGITYQTFSAEGEDDGDTAQPWAMFVIPQTDKTILLEENTQNLKAGDAKWKQRAAFAGMIGVGRSVPGTQQQ